MPADPRSFDHLAERYDAAASLERRPHFFLQHLPLRRQRALDVGCGTGLLACELARHFDSVTGLDRSEPMLAIARGKRSAPNLTYVQADADALVLDGRFDLIASHTTFHHLRDAARTLEVLRAALAPGGRLVLVDLVDRYPWFPRRMAAAHVAVACARLPGDLIHRGRHVAWTLFRVSTSRAWLAHLTTDRYLRPAEFRAIYGAALPGCTFHEMRHFMGVVWQAPE